jgi:hypothetical protein
MSRSHNDTHELIDGPPPEVLSEIEAAWERAQALVACGGAVIDPSVAVIV